MLPQEGWSTSRYGNGKEKLSIFCFPKHFVELLHCNSFDCVCFSDSHFLSCPGDCWDSHFLSCPVVVSQTLIKLVQSSPLDPVFTFLLLQFQPSPQWHPHLSSRTSASVSLSSLTPSTRDYRDHFQPSFPLLIPGSQPPGPSGIPWEHSSWAGQGNCWANEDFHYPLLSSKSNPQSQHQLLPFSPSAYISCGAHRPSPPSLRVPTCCWTQPETPADTSC